ncbi:MAG: flagellar basal body P-ring protein FlgI, partial [Rhodopirellula sp. JB053]
CLGMLLSTGCASWLNRGTKDDSEHLEKLMRVPEPPDLVREAAIPHGLREIRVDGVAVVNQLPGTGGPALPSSFRDQLLDEMKRNEVADPNGFLEQNDNALVQVRGLIPAGARRGDSIDLQILTPPKTEATDLHGGWLLDTRLRHQQVLNNSVRSSEVLAIGTGPVLTRGDFDGTDDTTLHVSGRVLSGGLVQTDRKLGLVLRPKFQHVKMAKAIAEALNRRFYFFDGTTRRGIAKAVEDDFIEIDVHPRYRHHEERLLHVVRAISVAPESSDTQARLVELSEKLRVPAEAAHAALQLEAIGEGAIPTLVEACNLTNPELRFYAAEALAYLDRSEAVEPLLAGIRNEPAFRSPSLSALLGLEHSSAVTGLQELLNEDSLETRYGAMTVMRDRKDARSSLGGENLNGQFRLYQIKSNGPPAVVVSLTRKPEVVLMGEVSPLALKSFFIGPAGMIVRRMNADETSLSGSASARLRISRFRPGRPDAFAEVDATLAGLIRGITEVGGGYGDTVATLRMAKEQGVLVDQLAFDPLPKSKRTYYRDDESDEDASDEDSSSEEDAKEL